MSTMKVFYCLDCKKIHISKPDNFTKCPECGGEIAVTNLSPGEWEEMTDEERQKIIKYMEKQGRAIKAQEKPKKDIGRRIFVAFLVIFGMLGAMTGGILIALHAFIPGLAVAIVTLSILIIAAIIDDFRKKSKKPEQNAYH